MGHHYLNQLFAPASIAVFGASERENTMGTLVLQNILSTDYSGKIYPINPKYKTVQGLTCYPSLNTVDQPVELAIITPPANRVLNIVRECGKQGCHNVMLLSSGFNSDGAKTQRLIKDLLEVIREFDIHLLGPNSMGILRPPINLNATFSKNQARPGKVALISQSNAMATAILDWAAARHIGFSTVATLGDALNVDFGDVLDYLALDPQTDSILVYLESIREARGFMSGLRAASRLKPVVVLKAGRHEEGMKAASSHTGVIVGSDDAFDAAMGRAGVVRVHTITQLFAATEILSSGVRVDGNRLMVMTNAGGPGIMATDHAIEAGLSMAAIPPELKKHLSEVLPSHWSGHNPVDILGDATPERYAATMELCLENPEADGLLIILTPQAVTESEKIAEAIVQINQRSSKPVLTCWMGGDQVAAGREILSTARIPTFQTPEAAVEAFAYLASYRSNQKLLMQVPPSIAEQARMPDIRGARLIIESVLGEGRKHLSATEARAILAAFQIPALPAILARSPAEALVAAESVGFPVALKINSPDILHKSDVNGIRPNINSPHTVRNIYQELQQRVPEIQPGARIDGITVEPMYKGHAARELAIGVMRDPVFGPIISFGAGGTAVEVHRDYAVALPPLNRYMSQKTIGRTHISRLLASFRQLPAINFQALEDTLLRVSELVCELPEVVEMDINPLMVNAEGVMVVDARFTVGYPDKASKHYDHMAIHPYPNNLIKRQQLADGTDILIRPIRPEDAGLEQEFVRNLSKESRYMRFMQALRELTPAMLTRLTQIDYDREMAFVALIPNSNGGDTELGVSRYAINPDRVSCEFALAVADNWQNQGLGRLLMQLLIEAARDRGLETITGDVLAQNAPMLKLMMRLGFERQIDAEDSGVVKVTKHLRSDH